MAEFKLAGRWKEFLDNSSASQSFYDSKMKRQDEKIRAGNQQLINQYGSGNVYTPGGGGSVGFYDPNQNPYQ
jgi:hypothetical protein